MLMEETVKVRSYKIAGKDVLVHPPGYSAYNTNQRLAILHIPKNASSAVKKSTTNANDWLPTTDIRAHNVARVCVILRDPVDRFLSAVNMYIGGRPILSNFVNIQNSNNKFFINSTNDAHFLPQACFLDPVNQDIVDFFYYNDNIIEDINQFYKLSLDTKKVYQSNKIITHADVNIIRQVYEEDYTLIKSVNFVNVKKGETL